MLSDALLALNINMSRYLLNTKHTALSKNVISELLGSYYFFASPLSVPLPLLLS